MKHYAHLILVLFLSGCYTQYNFISDKLPPSEQIHPHHKTVDTVLKHYFTDGAYEAVKDIPMVDGVAKSPYVVGVNGWSIVASIIIGNGYSRKVIMTRKGLRAWGVEAIIHEYIHHLDDMDRDGLGEWINHNDFVKAYIRLSKDKKYAGIVNYTEKRANSWITNWFGVGEYAEYIAYIGGFIFENNAPDYIRNVYRKILRLK